MAQSDHLDQNLLNTRPGATHANSAIHPSQASGCVAVPVTALVPHMTTVNKIATKKNTLAALARTTCL